MAEQPSNGAVGSTAAPASERRLAAIASGWPSVLVAFSGGVDSAVVLAAAARGCPGRVLAVTGASASVPQEELAIAARVAASLGVEHRVVSTTEVQSEAYAANPPERCYHCKSHLFERLRAEAAAEGLAVLAEGSNLDDLRDHRPGSRAARELGVVSPLRDAALGKAEVRELARWFGLEVAEKPAQPCLASRFPYGVRVTERGLLRVGRAERWLRTYFGLREVRVRSHGELARVEVLPGDMPRVLGAHLEVQAALKALGFVWVSLDLGGFRSGSLNEALPGDRAGGGPPGGRPGGGAQDA